MSINQILSVLQLDFVLFAAVDNGAVNREYAQRTIRHILINLL